MIVRVTPGSIVIFVLVSAACLAGAGTAMSDPVLTDSLYSAHHPRLLFSKGDIPALSAKMHDGGADDDAYAFIRSRVQTVYPSESPASILGTWYGLESIPEIGLVGHLESPPDTAAIALGRAVTTYIADTWEPDYDEAGSADRLRSLALGYDLFFENATPAERAYIRDEMVHYLQVMTWNQGYQVFQDRPYIGNHSAMIASALGLAAIVLQGEADPSLLDGAFSLADAIVDNLLQYMFDPGGSYNEGSLYALWTLKHLVYYFEARKRYDGLDYGSNPRIRAVETWLPYELLPEGRAVSQNLNDSGATATPFSTNSTYFDWAMHTWDSGLSSWLWEHSVGTYGVDEGAAADKAATALWHQSVPVVQPGDVLPLHRLWLQRGLYDFRTGWQSGASSDDVVFSFYSGKFEGGHAQEDQNQFALYGYGARLVIDHGPGFAAKQSEAHNMVLIDGKGQYNAGSSIGTDGKIAHYLLGGLADYIVGDATAAYSTHSEFNDPDQPVQGTDWSWGYEATSPVRYAVRRVVVVHGASAPPYFLIMDDIDKDDTVHSYEWRLHTLAGNTVTTATNPFTISTPVATMGVYMLNPDLSAVSVSTGTYSAGNGDPNSTMLRVTESAVNPQFSFLLMPRATAMSAPTVSNTPQSWGYACTVDWGGGLKDRLIRNDSGAAVGAYGITTDAQVALVRMNGSTIEGFFAANVTTLTVGSTDCIAIDNGPTTCEESDATIHLDRYDANFRFYDLGVTQVFYHDESLDFAVDNGFIVPGALTGVKAGPPAPRNLSLSVYPNPFNPATTIRVAAPLREPVRVEIFDVAGRRVRSLWNAPLGAAERTISWDGRNDAGAPVASGTYFVRAWTRSGTRTAKLTLLK